MIFIHLWLNELTCGQNVPLFIVRRRRKRKEKRRNTSKKGKMVESAKCRVTLSSLRVDFVTFLKDRPSVGLSKYIINPHDGQDTRHTCYIHISSLRFFYFYRRRRLFFSGFFPLCFLREKELKRLRTWHVSIIASTHYSGFFSPFFFCFFSFETFPRTKAETRVSPSSRVESTFSVHFSAN